MKKKKIMNISLSLSEVVTAIAEDEIQSKMTATIDDGEDCKPSRTPSSRKIAGAESWCLT